MSLWSKLVIGTKFLFCGFEPATDHVLYLLNNYIDKSGASINIQKYVNYVNVALMYLRKYERFCPAVWRKDYNTVISVVECLCTALSDSKVSLDEIKDIIANVKAAIAEWNKD